MVGEQYFKHGEGEGNGNSLVDDDIETLPYEVLKTYEVYDSWFKRTHFVSSELFRHSSRDTILQLSLSAIRPRTSTLSPTPSLVSRT